MQEVTWRTQLGLLQCDGELFNLMEVVAYADHPISVLDGGIGAAGESKGFVFCEEDAPRLSANLAASVDERVRAMKPCFVAATLASALTRIRR